MTWLLEYDSFTLERHVIPDYGRKHQWEDCWCQPKILEPPRDDIGPLVVHEATQ